MSAAARKAQHVPRSVAEYISAQIHLCGKSQIDIARETGFEKPNVITMIKQGKTKLPMDKIGKFAKAIEVDPIYLFKMCMAEYWPDTAKELQKIFGQPMLTENELDIIQVFRDSNVLNPKLRTDEERQELLAFANKLKSDN